MLSRNNIRIVFTAVLTVAAILSWGNGTAAGKYPVLSLEISPDHPLLIFQASHLETPLPAEYGERVIQAWGALNNALKPYATLRVNVSGPDIAARHTQYRALLEVIGEAEIPTVIQLADGDPAHAYPLDLAEELLKDFTFVKGVYVTGLSFDQYAVFGAEREPVEPPCVRWLIETIELAARYGRFCAVELDRVGWARVMANTACQPLYDKMKQCRAYVAPIAAFRDGQTIPNLSALTGLWLEGAVDQWGVAPSSEWYEQAGFLAPGRLGRGGPKGAMPSQLYRAMILCGAMTGAHVYSFGRGDDLWTGQRARHWAQVIEPAFLELIPKGLIARKSFVFKKVRVGYQLAPARMPQDFHLNLRDIDPVSDAGLLVRGAYGVDPGAMPELIPNTGRNYWIPIFSPYAPAEMLEGLAQVVRPGAMPSAEAWVSLLARHYRPDNSGLAFIARVGRGIFVLHTRENLYEAQPYRLNDLPEPVRGLEARRTDEGVSLTWPFRERDVAYRVHRRTLPDGQFEPIGEDIDAPRHDWVDRSAGAEDSVAYSVTALTTETAPQEGVVNLGDYLVLSIVESVPEEEVVITPLLGYGKGRPIEKPIDARPVDQKWWPTLDGVAEEHLPVAERIAQRIEAWDAAFSREDLDGVMDLYATDYQDPEGWQYQYARRAYQWFFERYTACTVQRQIRVWEFGNYATGKEVSVRVYCRLSGIARTDPSGREADTPTYFPLSETGEVTLTFREIEGTWRLVRTSPALPNFREILWFSTGPSSRFVPGPDVYRR